MIDLADEVQVPDRPDVSGLRFRRFRGADDYPDQAMTLYSSLGFEISSTSIDWTKPLPASTGVQAPPETR